MNDLARASISFGPFRLLAEARLLERNGAPIVLGSRALDLLTVLVERAGTVVPKRELMSRAWPGLTVDEGSLRFQIAALRKVLGDGVGGARYISNVRGRGYCFVAPVSASEAPPKSAEPARLLARQAIPPAADIVGRDSAIRQIALHLHAHRFVTIHGPGGIGKTTVAAGIANAEAAAFDGNVVFLDLATIKDPSLVASAFASALGLAVETSDPVPSILALLTDMRALIVLDSCEHVIDRVALLTERIHREAPSVCILATSREPLRSVGERVIQLPPLDLPPENETISAAQILQFPAAQLFAERASAAGLNADLSDADAETLAEMCRALDGLPLAIEIAASRSGRHGLAETAQLLNGRFRLLWRGRRSALPRHQTLYATLDWSFALLSPREQTALQRLSVFTGFFTLDAARAIACDGPDDQGFVGEVLEELVAKSMIFIDLCGGTARYRLLDTTRTYAQAKLAENHAVQAVAVRHACYVADRLTSLDLVTKESEQAAGDLLGDLRAALAWAFSKDGDRGSALRLAAVGGQILIHFSLFEECRGWAERALTILDAKERGGELEMKLEATFGTVLILTQTNDERAQAAIERALALANHLGDLRTEYLMLYRLQLLHRRTGAFNLLLPLAKQLETLAENIDERECAVSALAMIASSHALTGDQALAHNLLEQAAEAQRATPTIPAHFAYVGDVRIALARTLWLRGLPDQAARMARIVSTGNVPVLFSCMSLSWSAAVFWEIGDHASAERLAANLRETARRYSLGPYQVVGMGFAGQALVEKGEIDEAIGNLKNTLDLLRGRRYGLYVSLFARSLAEALTRAGRLAEAERVAQAQIDEIESIGGAYDLPEWLRIRGEIEASIGDAQTAEVTFRSAIALAERQSALSWRLRAETSLARLLLEQGRGQEASARLVAALALFEEGFATHDLISASHLLEEIGQAGP